MEMTIDQKYNHEDKYVYASFEGTIVMCYKEMRNADRALEAHALTESPLISRYRELMESEQPEGVQPPPDFYYAKAVEETVKYSGTRRGSYLPFGFREAVRRIELLAGIDAG